MRSTLTSPALALALLAVLPVCSAQTDAAIAAASKETGAKVTASGLVYMSLKEGTGAKPAASDSVKVHYKGSFPDGREFDSSYKRNAPTEFPRTVSFPAGRRACR